MAFQDILDGLSETLDSAGEIARGVGEVGEAVQGAEDKIKGSTGTPTSTEKDVQRDVVENASGPLNSASNNIPWRIVGWSVGGIVASFVVYKLLK